MRRPLLPLAVLLPLIAGTPGALSQDAPPPAPPAPALPPAPSDRPGGHGPSDPAAPETPAAGATETPRAKPQPSRSRMEYVPVSSQALGRTVPVGVYLPAAYALEPDRRFPVLYFLHGLFGSERKWEQRGTPRVLDALIAAGTEPMIVVCPDGENSMYLNWVSKKGDWMDFVVKDLVPWTDGRYRTLADRGHRGLSGDSMGGFGALNIGLQHRDVFSSISAHSAALFPVDPEQVSPGVKRWSRRWGDVFGDPLDLAFWKANNPIHLAATLPADELARLSIYFDVGEADHFGFTATNVRLHEVLEEREVPHHFAIRAGDHGREYFNENVDQSLKFHGEHFRAANAAARDV